MLKSPRPGPQRLRSPLQGPREGLGAGAGGSAPSCHVPVAAAPPPAARQEPSFGSLIISASSPRCICNDLFTSLRRSLCQAGLSLRTGAMPCSHLPRFLLPHTARHGAASGNACAPASGTIRCTEVSRIATQSPSSCRGAPTTCCLSPLQGPAGPAAHSRRLSVIQA